MSFDAGDLVKLLKEKGDEIAPEAASKGFSALLDEGKDFLDGQDAGELKDAGEKALETLEKNRQPFERLTVEGFAWILGHFGNDEEEQAKNHYIATQATYAERRKWMQEGGDLAVKEKEERESAWEAVKETLKTIVVDGLPFLAKLAGKMLGLPIPF